MNPQLSGGLEQTGEAPIGAPSGRSSPRRAAPSGRGVLLVLIAGMLAILAALGSAFFTLMHMEMLSTVRYGDMVRADMMAKAGIQDAIARIRVNTFIQTESPNDNWYPVDCLHGGARRVSMSYGDGLDTNGDGIVDNEPGKTYKPYTRAMSSSVAIDSDQYSLEVEDAASKININACDNLAVVLDNLCRAIGSPLIPAADDVLLPRRWFVESNEEMVAYGSNTQDLLANRDVYYALDTKGRPVQRNQPPYQAILALLGKTLDGTAVYGDGYAIAGYRSRHGLFTNLEQVKQALTFVDRNNNGKLDDPLEMLEVEVKFACLKPYVTTRSWVDTTTVCTGKFEWAGLIQHDEVNLPVRNLLSGSVEQSVPCQILMDRDKSWVADDPAGDPLNTRGSLRGSYVAIINGHGAGQFRRIATNGIDWIALRGYGGLTDESMYVPPGPISSYMIFAREDARLQELRDSGGKTMCLLPETDVNGQFVDDPNTDYERYPLCIHRAPVNLNTASDKVLTALFMGINVTHGSFLAVGTDADLQKLAPMNRSRWDWKPTDPDWQIRDYDDTGGTWPPSKNPYRTVEPYILTAKGLKRVPADPGKITYDVDYDVVYKPNLPATYDLGYVGNYGKTDPAGTAKINEAQELAVRIILARQADPAYPYINPVNGCPVAAGSEAHRRGPFHCWEDLYSRVVRPWDESRLDSANPRCDPKRGLVARMVMSHFDPNADILKFNPNIEWIDRWGRNFTEMEPVMVYTNQPEAWLDRSLGHGVIDSSDPNLLTTLPRTCDQDGAMTNAAIPIFTRERSQQWPNFSSGAYGTDPQYMGTYVTRSYRYRADEMIDKTDLNRSTTEFSFDSRGIFEITSTGRVMQTATAQLLAERKIDALIRVYDVWSESSQRQFVNGYISRATGTPGTAQSGNIARDATNINSRLALTTLPEPLVPLQYRLGSTPGTNAGRNEELTDVIPNPGGVKRDAWCKAVTDMRLPDVLSNHVLPAGYDGQLVLATNTARFNPSQGGDCDTFLASFNGDTDTDTCLDNGREQAKSNLDCRVRSVDTCSLLGVLNDPLSMRGADGGLWKWIESDPGLSGDCSWNAPNNYVRADLPNFPPPATGPRTYSGTPLKIYRYNVAMNCLRGLDPTFYWNNVSCRQGDLRPDGCWVGGAGVTGNDGVLKYLCGDVSKPDRANYSMNGPGCAAARGEDYNNRGTAGNVRGFLFSTWAKTTWHHNDGRNHEFLDCSTPGWNDNGVRSEAWYLRKQGRVQWAVSERRNSGGGIIKITDSTHDMVPAEDWTWGISGSGNRVDDLSWCGEPIQDAGDWSEPDWPIYLHGGTSGVPLDRRTMLDNRPRPDPGPESPAYRVQPFRWHFLGMRIFLQQDLAKCVPPNTNTGLKTGAPSALPSAANERKSGFWKDQYVTEAWKDQDSMWVATNLFRPFIDSERWPEGPSYKPFGKYWVVTQAQGSTGFKAFQDKGRAGAVAARGDGGQSLRWTWAHPGGMTANRGRTIDNCTFGVNNCNPGWNYMNCNSFCSIYKNSPDEGTYAVLDELKISNKETMLRNPSEPFDDRITRRNAAQPGEMTVSRYYLPANPANPDACPTFVSQTMLQSLKGYDKGTSIPPQYVALARVSWNVFTPRFMAEYKDPGRFLRSEVITRKTREYPDLMVVPFRGPFDYCKYNNIQINGDPSYPKWDNKVGEYTVRPKGAGETERVDWDDPTFDSDVRIFPYRCGRPTPDQYATVGSLPQAVRGVEVEVLEDVDTDPSNGNEVVCAGPFNNPLLNNGIGTVTSPIKVRTDRLRYRVRFRYPADPLADKPAANAGRTWVDGVNQYLLDTPVFDDISITTFSKPRILDYHEVTE